MIFALLKGPKVIIITANLVYVRVWDFIRIQNINNKISICIVTIWVPRYIFNVLFMDNKHCGINMAKLYFITM